MGHEWKQDPETPVPALVLGSGITALGAVRSLGLAGIPTYCLTDKLEFVAASRWCRRIADRIRPGDALEPALERLPFERGVLFPCSDDLVLEAADVAERSAGRFATSTPPAALARTLLDKASLAEVLVRHDVPHPRTVVLDSEHDLEPLSDETIEGAFLKPRDSKAFSTRYRKKALAVDSREEAVAQMRTLREHGMQMLLQEYLPGPASRHYFIDGYVDRTGRIKARIARRRLRMDPPDFGNSTYMVTIPIAEVGAAAESLDRLLPALGYRGIFSAEFKHDARDGRFKLLEINVRPWWYVGFATSCGVNVCRMAYEEALGHEVEAIADYPVGVTHMNFRRDLAVCMRELMRGRPGALLQPFGWLRARATIFHWRDPLPLPASALSWLGRRLSRTTASSSSTRDSRSTPDATPLPGPGPLNRRQP